eukprot:6479327-Amphidinium_carterae.1
MQDQSGAQEEQDWMYNMKHPKEEGFDTLHQDIELWKSCPHLPEPHVASEPSLQMAAKALLARQQRNHPPFTPNSPHCSKGRCRMRAPRGVDALHALS